MAALCNLFVTLILLNCVIIMAALPEQGVRKLRLFSSQNQAESIIYAGLSKSMYAGSILSLNIKCTPGMTVDVAWGIRSAVCANEFLDDYISYNILDNEWDTIDNAVHRMDISAKLVDEINDHIYLKFSRRRFTCQANGTISLPNWSDRFFQHLDVKAQTEAPVPSSGKIDDAASKTGGETEFPADSDDDLTGEDVFRPPKPAALSPSGRKSTNKSSKTNQVGKSTSTASILISRAKRAAEVSPSSPTMPTTSKRPAVVPGALVKVPTDNIYIFIVRITDKLPDGNISMVVKTYGSYGYLSMIDWPLLPFYAMMCAMYALFLIFWSILCCCYCKDLLRVQYWIGAVIFIGFVEESAFLGEYHTVDQTGQSVPGAVIFGELVSAGKRTLSRVLVIIVSIGYGIVKPRLGPTASKVAVVGIVYFIMSSIEGFMRASVHKAKEQTTGMTVFLIVLSVTDALICWWIFTALVNTMRTLRLRRNLVKLSLYRHFTNTLIFSVLASMAFLIWSLVEHKRAQCLTDWRELWVDDAFWHLLFSVILLVVMILWRPSANNQRYAYSALADGADDEAGEPMMNEAFEGVKMRGTKNPADVKRQSSDQTEEDLKWIEENIPSSVADGALPSLLDSEEEIMTTKYELSKMQ